MSRSEVLNELQSVRKSMKIMEDTADDTIATVGRSLQEVKSDLVFLDETFSTLESKLLSLSGPQWPLKPVAKLLTDTAKEVDELNGEVKSRIIYRLPGDQQRQKLALAAGELATRTIEVVDRVFALEVERYKRDAEARLDKAGSELASAFSAKMPELEGKLESYCLMATENMEGVVRDAERQGQELIDNLIGHLQVLEVSCGEKEVRDALCELLTVGEDGAIPKVMAKYKSSLQDVLSKLTCNIDMTINKEDMTPLELRELRSRITTIEAELLKSIDTILSRVGILRNKTSTTNLSGLLDLTGTTDFPSAIGSRVDQILKTILATK